MEQQHSVQRLQVMLGVPWESHSTLSVLCLGEGLGGCVRVWPGLIWDAAVLWTQKLQGAMGDILLGAGRVCGRCWPISCFEVSSSSNMISLKKVLNKANTKCPDDLDLSWAANRIFATWPEITSPRCHATHVQIFPPSLVSHRHN